MANSFNLFIDFPDLSLPAKQRNSHNFQLAAFSFKYPVTTFYKDVPCRNFSIFLFFRESAGLEKKEFSVSSPPMN